ncbi:MAG: DUF2281 domain-containing protein [Nostochopsis sp.]
MTIKELLLQEIESTPDTILAETLDFLRFLKTKETQTHALTEAESTTHIAVNYTGRSLLEHLKTIGEWSGDDLQDCLQLVYATRGKAKFNCCT